MAKTPKIQLPFTSICMRSRFPLFTSWILDHAVGACLLTGNNIDIESTSATWQDGLTRALIIKPYLLPYNVYDLDQRSAYTCSVVAWWMRRTVWRVRWRHLPHIIDRPNIFTRFPYWLNAESSSHPSHDTYKIVVQVRTTFFPCMIAFSCWRYWISRKEQT